LHSALSDLTVWPDTQTAEVHTRFEAVQNAIETSVDEGATSLVFYYVHVDFQGCGIGSKMLAEVYNSAAQFSQLTPLTGVFRGEDVEFGTVAGWRHKCDAGKLRILEHVS